MRHKNWVTALKLEQWADELVARSLLPKVLRRLVQATLPATEIEEIEFPSEEGVQRTGVDGFTKVKASNAKVPLGITAWELGCDSKIKGKADSDFTKRVSDVLSVFVFVTPRKWSSKTKWGKGKNQLGVWREVRAYDSSDLEEWLEMAPAVDVWLANEMGLAPPGVSDVATHWKNLSATCRVTLLPSFVLTNRLNAVEVTLKRLHGNPSVVAIEAPSPEEVVDFISALVASLDQDKQDAISSRTLIVEEREAWRMLAASGGGLILVVGPRLELEDELQAEAVRQGNHVVRFATSRQRQEEGVIQLGKMWEPSLHEALREANLGSSDVQRLSREAGGTFTILKRLLSRNPIASTPKWSRGVEAVRLAPLMLAGGWNDDNEADRKIVSRLMGRPYDDIQRDLNVIMGESDSPLKFVRKEWTFISRIDSWRFLSSALTRDLLDLFEAVALEVLSESDPALEIAKEERYLASIRGKKLNFSATLREGLGETLGLMGSHELYDQSNPLRLKARAASVVRKLFTKADWRRWTSLSHHLPNLAEAAPDVFLQAVESDLKLSQPLVLELFRQEGDGFFGGSYHAGLLWALEVLAWEPRFLSRSSLCLTKLASLDPGGRLTNRPANSLRAIYLPWFPQNKATIIERIAILQHILKQEPVVGWNLLLGLLPKFHDMASGIYKPQWQKWFNNWTDGATDDEINECIKALAHILVNNSKSDITRLASLVDHIDELPAEAIHEILNGFRQIKNDFKRKLEFAKIWDNLREKGSRHRYGQGLKWALYEDIVIDIEQAVIDLAPEDPVERTKWLFNSGCGLEVGRHGMAHDERKELLFIKRLDAFKEVWQLKGFDGLIEIVDKTNMTFEVASVAEKSLLIHDSDSVIPPLLTSMNGKHVQFAKTYLAYRFYSQGWPWIENLISKNWPIEQKVIMLTVIPFQSKLWEFAATLGPEIETLFWKKACVGSHGLSEDQIIFAVEKLRNAERPLSIIDFVDYARRNGVRFSEDFLLDVLEGALFSKKTSEQDMVDLGMIRYHIIELFEFLQKTPSTNQDRLSGLEWVSLKLLDGHHQTPVALHRKLSENPSFFSEIISFLYKPKPTRTKPTKVKSFPKNNKIKTKEATEKAYQLLDSWTTMPGEEEGGAINEAKLKEWVSEARKMCFASGRFDCADCEIGKLFAYSPEDPDGSWPCLCVRNIMEEINSERVFDGFENGIFNKRGVWSRSLTEGGAQERKLAEKFQQQAEKIRAAWPLVAASLERMAESYLEDAVRYDEQRDAR